MLNKPRIKSYTMTAKIEKHTTVQVLGWEIHVLGNVSNRLATERKEDLTKDRDYKDLYLMTELLWR